MPDTVESFLKEQSIAINAMFASSSELQYVRSTNLVAASAVDIEARRLFDMHHVRAAFTLAALVVVSIFASK